MIDCNNLIKKFDDNNGIFDINITFYPGQIYGIIGYNGAGKTTLLRCIEGLYLPTSGTVLHNGISTYNEIEFGKFRKNISFLPSDDFLYNNLTCNENLELATILRTGRKNISKITYELIKYFDVSKFLYKKFSSCSTGMRKKVQLIATLIGDINTIIWDEPNDGLDIVTNIKLKQILKYFKENNKTILFSSHVAEFLDNFVDHFILLQSGRIIEYNKANSINSFNDLLLNYIDKSELKLPFE